MNIPKLAAVLATAALWAGAPALAKGHDMEAMDQHEMNPGMDHHQSAAKLTRKEKAKARTIELTVTKAGFEPAEVKVKKGEPLKLVVTRKVAKTCATEIVMKDEGVKAELPLDKPVTIYVKPAKSGSIRYACAMDMISGQLIVE
ncbi:MAG TPA: cupredoxin domain-containing protein [Anaeromyxobacteraceae bacterium]|nr:cupredoxin domain-containing protein [Anaeromyxobacteraceae bacterium]